MANDISGFGVQVALSASITFPAGLVISQFADDVDPIDIEAIQILDKAMGLNGDLVTWAKATPCPMVLAVIPNSDDDLNLQVIANSNRVGRGKRSAQDTIQATVIYPDGSTKSLSNGKLTNAQFGIGIASAGRMKTKVYTFTFENVI